MEIVDSLSRRGTFFRFNFESKEMRGKLRQTMGPSQTLLSYPAQPSVEFLKVGLGSPEHGVRWFPFTIRLIYLLACSRCYISQPNMGER
jgi:hypothetical protein